MRTQIVGFVVLFCAISAAGGGSNVATAQSVEPALGAAPAVNPVAGSWTYRSFVSEPDLETEPNDLLFGRGTLQLSVSASDELTGTLGGPGWELTLKGAYSGGAIPSIRFQGKGVISGEEWVYDYVGFVVPVWPNGVNQRPAIVGSIVRTKAHSGGAATAGVVAQWIAVKQDPADAGAAKVAAPAQGAAAPTADDDLRQFVFDWAKAVESNDLARLADFFADDFLFVGAEGVLQSREQHLEDFRSGRLRVTNVQPQDLVARRVGDFAVVSSLAAVQGTFDGRDIAGNYRFLDVNCKIRGQWKSVARQQTRVAPQGDHDGAVDAQGLGLPTDSPERGSSPYRQKIRDRYLEEPSPASLQKDTAAPAEGALAVAASPRPAPFGAMSLPSSSLQPDTIRSSGGRLDVELVVEYETFQIGNHAVRLRTYNKKLVGPVLRAKAGDTLYITLRNKLPVLPSTPHDLNSHHEWNTTNLHYHGLHVEPQGTPAAESDNVLLELAPTSDPAGSVQNYAVKIPPDHVAGTFWYHPHKHGAVTAQVASGMAGALIIERTDNSHNLDSVPEVAVASVAEEILVLQQIPYLKPSAADGEIEQSPGGSGANESDMFAPGSWARLRRYVTVNGLKIPTISMQPGEVRRFRLVDAGQREALALRIEKASSAATGPALIPMHEIAVDGLPTGGIRAVDTLVLAPGYRSDVLIQAPATASGEYDLVDANAPAGTGADGSPEPLRVISRIIIRGTPRPMALPAAATLAPHRLPNLDGATVTGTQYAFYGLVFPGDDINFFISRNNLAPGQVPTGEEFTLSNPRVLIRDHTERWLIGTRNGNNVGQFHPFHIHTNPFLITKVTRVVNGAMTDVTAQEIGGPTWRDTLAMKQGYTYELLTKYADFTGSFVQHCHILDHEDNGMMELIRIDPPSVAGAPVTIKAVRISSSIPPSKGKPSLLLFVKGSLCPHCMEQLAATNRELVGLDCNISVISASTEDDLRSFPAFPFTLVADPDDRLFKQYGVFDGEAKHGTLVLDREGREVFRRIGDEPFTDMGAIAAAIVGAGDATAAQTRASELGRAAGSQ